MDLTGLLNDALSGDTISQISQTIGADESTTSNAIQAALPALLGGLAHNSSTDEGASALADALEDHDGSILGNLGGLLGNIAQGQGAGILGHIFGGQTDTVADGVSQASGLDAGQAGQLLMALAPIVMGVLGRAQRENGLGAGDLSGLLGGAAQQMGSGSPLMGILSSVLDRNHDGSAVDDVMGMIGGFLGGRK